MMSLKPVKYILLLLCLFTFTQSSYAQDFSYVYIQGDKETPFYVKFEGEMLPRYGKNYIIIPMLAPGPVNIEILFQQNKFPAQKFVIQVPESGFRAFMISKKANSFALYDFYQKFYIHPGNKAIDDKAPDNDPSNKYLSTSNTTIKTAPQTAQVTTNTTTRTQPATSTNGNNSPKFIADIQINSGNTDVAQPKTTPPVNDQTNNIPNTKSKPITTNTPPPSTANNNTTPSTTNTIVGAPIINSDCPTAMTNGEFENIYKKALDKSEKLRLKYLLSEMELCYSTSQAKSLALTLSNDPEKYTFLKRVYPRITDQAQFPALENLLSTNEWKSYFKLILPE